MTKQQEVFGVADTCPLYFMLFAGPFMQSVVEDCRILVKTNKLYMHLFNWGSHLV